MAQQHGTKAVIVVWDTGGTCRFISGDTTSYTISWTKDNPDSTTLGNDTHQRISGLRDGNLSFSSIYDTTATTGIDAIMRDIIAGSANTLVHLAPGGSISGSPLYSACMLANAWEMTVPVDGIVTATGGFDISSGSITVIDQS